jgi:bisphosphoglycerate-dependent phosphoglycerate mutase family 1
MVKYHIYIFRHGQTYYNKNKIFTGWKDSKLTKLGIKQARIIAKKLKHKKIDIAFQTRLSRSKQTLKEVLKYHPECKKIITDNRIIERNYGDLNGTSHKEFIKKIGDKLFNVEVYGDMIENLTPEDKRKIQEFLGEEEFKLIHRGYDVPPPNGESFLDVEKRVQLFIHDLKKLIKIQKINVAISAHGNSIRLFRKVLENASKKMVVKWIIPYDKYYHYVIDA